MQHTLKRYKKGDPLSYSLGVSPTLELLSVRPQIAREVILSSKAGRNEGVDRIREVCVAGGIPVTENDRAIARLSPKESCLAVGVFAAYQERLDPAVPHVVLVQPSNRGNAGTIMRTMAAFGFHDLALIGPSVDHLDPQTVRASMGAVFRLRVEKLLDLESYRARHARTMYAFRKDGSVQLDDADFNGVFSLIFGSEGPGLPEIGGSIGVSIPQARDIDSLNLSTAAAVVLYRARRL